MSSRPTQRAPARPCVAPEDPNAGQPGLLRRVPAILYTADSGESGGWHYVSPQIEWMLGFSS